jgi:polyisoprenoid-binding protein YceI
LSAQGLRIDFDGSSEARYHAQEVLARTRLPNQAVGRTNQVTGAIVIDSAGKLVPAESKVTVDLRMLTSDERLRDRFIREDTLQTSRFPNAELVVTEVRGLPWPAPTAGEVKFQVAGDLTVHGVTRPTVWDVVANVAGRDVSATATTQVKITDFGMAIPRVATVLSLEDELTLDLETKTQLN